MQNRRIRLPLLLCVVSPLAIVAGQSAKVRDSAGVRIVENASRMKAPVTFSLSASPIMDVGGLEDVTDNEFNHKQGYLRAVRLSDGGLAVIDVTRVHIFDARGKRLKISGRDGSGPGEFRYATAICRTRGDTIVVGDRRNSRVTLLDRAGTFIRSIPLTDAANLPFNGCFSDGFVTNRLQGPKAETHALTYIGLNGTTQVHFTPMAGASLDLVTEKETSIAAGGDRLYFGNGKTSEWQAFTPTGKLVMIVRTNDPLTPVTDAEAEAGLAATIPNNVSAAERARRLEQMHASSHSSTWPAYSYFQVDDDGRLWVQDYEKSPVSRGWTTFDKSGQMIGRLELPKPAPGKRLPLVIGFGKSEIVLRTWDEDGASHLQVYAIVRSNAVKS